VVKNRFQKILSVIVEIKPGEEILALLFFFYFFLITAPYSIIKSIRDARYLEDVGSIWLPLAYFLTAILMGFVVAFHSKLLAKIQSGILVIFSLIFFILTCFLFWVLFLERWTWVPVVFYFWANIFVAVLVTQFWILVNDVFNPREVKRLIGFFGSGGILGGVFGGLLTGFLAKFKISEFLLLIALGMLIAGVFVVYAINSRQMKKAPLVSQIKIRGQGKQEETSGLGFKDCFDTVKKDYYLKLLAAVVLITWIVSTLIDWQSKNVIDQRMSGLKNLIAFFGYFNAGVLILPFFLQLLMTSGLIKRYGIRFNLMVYPIILLLGSLGVAIAPILLFAIVIKANDKSLSFSLNQSVRELLYIPISPDVKYKAKIFIDMFINRFAKGVGALFLMIFIPLRLGIQLRIQLVSLVSALFIFGWIFLNLKISREYTNTVKQKLEAKWNRADRLVAEKVDVDYTKLVFDTIESKERSSVLYAMHLFDLIKEDKLTPEVKKLISYKSDELRVSSLGALFEAEEATLVPEVDVSLDEEVLKKEIKEIMSLDVYQEVMEGYFEKAVADRSKEGEVTKMELAKAIGLMEPHSPLIQKLEDLIQDESPEVSRYAMESAAKLRRREYVPALIQKLHSPVAEEDAGAALEKFGPKIVGTLADYLGDKDEEMELRKEVASILARIGTQEAADFLTWELAEDRGDLDTELIDALDGIRSKTPEIQFQEPVIKAKTAKEVKRYCETFIRFYESQKKGEKDKAGRIFEKDLIVFRLNIFKLLGLIYPHEDIFRAYQNIRTGTKDSVAYAVELLDNVLKREIKDVIFPIVEDLSLEERLRRFQSLLEAFPDI